MRRKVPAAFLILIPLMVGALWAQNNSHGKDESQPFLSTEYLKEIKPILREKCFDCHTKFTHYPWYYRLPGAKQLIDKDIKNARKKMDISEGMQTSDLNNLQMVIEDGSMPPLRYKLLHRRAGLSQNEKEKLLSWIKDNLSSTAQIKIPSSPNSEPIFPLVPPSHLDEEKVALGRKLFHDRRLSKDNTISCASCHSLDKGGVDQMPRSFGVGGTQGDINTPTVFNSSLNFKQFWDGRANTLEEQAAGPIHNPKEMATSWEEVVEKLKKDSEYKSQFKKSYGNITGDHIANAIAEFERSLITVNSRFDKYLLEDQRAISEEEKQGYLLFKTYGCVSCHQGSNVGGNLFEKFGVMGDYFSDRGNVTKADNGRFNVTGKEEDRHKFKIPSLRNAELTPPYFHDGHAKTLEDAVKIMVKYQLGKRIPDNEVALIVKFLKTLTGEFEGKSLWTSKN